MTPGAGIEPGPHWWEASALTTAPFLLPNHDHVWISSYHYRYCLWVTEMAIQCQRWAVQRFCNLLILHVYCWGVAWHIGIDCRKSIRLHS